VLENGRIENYQVITPTAWNVGPRDSGQVLGLPATPGPADNCRSSSSAACDMLPPRRDHAIRCSTWPPPVRGGGNELHDHGGVGWNRLGRWLLKDEYPDDVVVLDEVAG
jgi:hypothetical protein